jgi:hypothetical protein
MACIREHKHPCMTDRWRAPGAGTVPSGWQLRRVPTVRWLAVSYKTCRSFCFSDRSAIASRDRWLRRCLQVIGTYELRVSTRSAQTNDCHIKVLSLAFEAERAVGAFRVYRWTTRCTKGVVQTG